VGEIPPDFRPRTPVRNLAAALLAALRVEVTQMLAPKLDIGSEAPANAQFPADTASFAQLVIPLEPALFARAMGLERSVQDARDLVQDTLERALRNFYQFQTGTNVKLWLYRIMYNLFVDRYRRRSHELGAENLDEIDLPAPEPEPLAPWQSVDVQHFNATLMRLDAPFRRVLELHFLDERSYREISVELGIPTGTVGTRLLRARKKFRALLDETAELRA
jgi:RNA polymerase sigma-70 factor (ECF subfamily)